MFPSTLGSSANPVASLTRAFAREIENLPTRYLREFYKIKVKDDVKALPSPDSPHFKARYKRVSRELRKLEAANNGSGAAYQHILSLAYGRKGKLRRELLEPLFSDPCAPLPPPIIPAVKSSRPPVYSPEITALLGSTFSRDGSIQRTPTQLQNPPIIPERANPTSFDGRILGPLSKRREVNLKRRFFKSETTRVLPPIEASRVHVLQEITPLEKSTIEESNAENAEQHTPPSVGFQGTSVLHDLEAIASPNPRVPKRPIDPTFPDPPCNVTSISASTPTVNRFIRRQHQKILTKIPILTYFKRLGSSAGKYQVSLSPLAHPGLSIRLTAAVPTADESDLAWLRLPPPPNADLKSTSSQQPKTEVKLVGETKQELDQDPRVDRPSEHQPCLVDDPLQKELEAKLKPLKMEGVTGGSEPSSLREILRSLEGRQQSNW